MSLAPLFLIALLGMVITTPIWWPILTRMRQQQHFKKIAQIIEQLYQDANPYQLSIQARNKLKTEDKSFVYGEVDIITLLDILSQITLPKEAVFYDLGSGAGKQVVAAGLYYPFKLAIGIEYLDNLYDLSQIKLKQLIKGGFLTKAQLKQVTNKLQFIQGSYFECDFSDADCLLVNATCISQENWKRLKTKLKDLKAGSFIIIITKRLTEPKFALVLERTYMMSWGFATTRIYQRQ